MEKEYHSEECPFFPVRVRIMGDKEKKELRVVWEKVEQPPDPPSPPAENDNPLEWLP